MPTHSRITDDLLKMSGSYWAACALHAGIKLDLFTVIGGNGFPAHKLASDTGISERGLVMLLNALAAMKLLKKKGEIFSNTKASRRLLAKDSLGYIGHILLHHHYLMESWAHLDESVRSGKPLRERSSRENPEQRESFLMGMFNLAMKLAPDVIARINLAGRGNLLDMGGGPGTYAVHFCLDNPGLQATVFDLPTTKPFALKTIKQFGLSKRIKFRAGDYLKDSIPGTYDVALLSHVLHGEGPDDCQRMLNKTVAALNPKGMIIIHEFILDNSMDAPLQPALFSLNMLLGTKAGQAYSEKQIMSMMAKAAVKDIKRLSFKPPGGSGVIVGYI